MNLFQCQRSTLTGLIVPRSVDNSHSHPARDCRRWKHSLLQSLSFAVESESPQYRQILLRLADEGVEAIVVGMAAAIIQGVPTTTWDLDVVHRRTPENVQRLLSVLDDLKAFARHDPRRLKPNATHL